MYRYLSTFFLVVCLLWASSAAAGDLPDPALETVFGRQAFQLADYVEHRAHGVTFEDLEAFGDQAERRDDREGLNRLYHVTWTILSQGDYPRAARWNVRLRLAARQQRDQRYIQIADLNDLALRYDQGERGVLEEATRYLTQNNDWFVRVHAARLTALSLIDAGRLGDGLKLLSDIQADIPSRDPFALTAQAGVWEIVGMGLKDIGDIQGAVQAFHRFEIEYANPEYPRPDFDSLYNLTRMAVSLGDTDAARHFFAAHHRLAQRSNLEVLRLFDADLCSQVAGSTGRYRVVLKCLEPFGEAMEAASYPLIGPLPERAVARARLGQVAGARRDLRRLQAMGDRSDFSIPLPLVEAEILFAENRPTEAYAMLRTYQQTSQVESMRTFAAGVHQVAGDMQQRAADRREQLVTSRGYTRLQKVALVLALLFVVVLIGVMLWQLRQGRQLKIERRRADAANRAKSEFLANMSHEIRTPLNGVVSMADALSRSQLKQADLEMVALIRSSGHTLERLLTDILDTAKIEAGQMNLEPTSFDLHHTVSDVVLLWRAMAEAKGVDLVLEYDPACRDWVVGDAVRLRQVLTNLVSNSLKFTSEGAVTLSVSPGEGDMIAFAVRDTGVGFDADQKARIFQRFQQADGSITRRFGGTGLGLAISHALVELMGGALDCDSIPGEGSVFTFAIALPAGTALEPAEAVDAPAAMDLETRPLRVLLADDHPANRKVVEIMLSVTAMELVEVEDGAQAVAAFADDTFDLVLMDMQMPVMDGLTACREIRQLEADRQSRRVPILMLTANAMAEHVEQGRHAGADGHLAKPITMASLLTAIANVLAEPSVAQAA